MHLFLQINWADHEGSLLSVCQAAPNTDIHIASVNAFYALGVGNAATVPSLALDLSTHCTDIVCI